MAQVLIIIAASIFLLLGTGLAGIGAVVRKKKKQEE